MRTAQHPYKYNPKCSLSTEIGFALKKGLLAVFQKKTRPKQFVSNRLEIVFSVLFLVEGRGDFEINTNWTLFFESLSVRKI